MSQESQANSPLQLRGVDKGDRTRDPYLDNAKAVLIILVVVGHAIEWIDRGSADALYTWIYLFHMPAFVLVSGYFSRSFHGTPQQMTAIIGVLLAPYVVVQTVLAVENWLVRGNDFVLQLFIPTFTLWYLCALLVWRLATPLLRAMKHPVLFSFSVSLLSVLAGGISQELSGARILSFLPFFTLGLLATPEHIDAFKRWTSSLWLRGGIAALLLALMPLVYVFRESIQRRWLYMYGRVETFGLSEGEDLLLRASVLLVATAMAGALFAIIPRRRSVITVLGERTLEIYLLHTVILYPLIPLIDSWSGWSLVTVMAMVVAAVALAFILSTPVVMKLTRWLTSPLSVVSGVQQRLAIKSETDHS